MPLNPFILLYFLMKNMTFSKILGLRTVKNESATQHRDIYWVAEQFF